MSGRQVCPRRPTPPTPVLHRGILHNGFDPGASIGSTHARDASPGRRGFPVRLQAGPTRRTNATARERGAPTYAASRADTAARWRLIRPRRNCVRERRELLQRFHSRQTARPTKNPHYFGAEPYPGLHPNPGGTSDNRWRLLLQDSSMARPESEASLSGAERLNRRTRIPVLLREGDVCLPHQARPEDC